MRKTVSLMDHWRFIREDVGAEEASQARSRDGWQEVSLPHTWNAEDGQDGGDDYYRGTCWYVKEFEDSGLSEDEELWIEFAGAAMSAKVYLNGKYLGDHKGGYSTFRMNLTDALQRENVLAVSVDNSANREVYPQKADFTFYGGIYRDVKLIRVPKAHFALGYYGGTGVKITPVLVDAEGRKITETDMEALREMEPAEKGEAFLSVKEYPAGAEVTVECWTEQAPDGSIVEFGILDGDGKEAACKKAVVSDQHAKEVLRISNPHLWDGKADPYLYTLKARLLRESDSRNARPEGLRNHSECDAGLAEDQAENQAEDQEKNQAEDLVELQFGCRNFRVDPEKGFFLNGRSYPLCGAARHQDRQGAGNALMREMQEEDMKIMLEMGANAVRMAHYQHDQYFYDLADRYGMIVWAEIPYISEHMPEARENTLSQMTELIVQNAHHPSIICWALSNEITVSSGVTEDMMENHRLLNDLCHRLDPDRLTTMANVFMLETGEDIVKLPDIRSYNLYYGWYVGELEENDAWFDQFHEDYPDLAIGLSEYGADANPQYQAAAPSKGDYTEGYQALYHEHMLEMWAKRPFIWAMHVWNMFDFGADGRSEGGKPGQNQKGLVTFDRKIRKDAFYIYKAYLSDEPFVHLCGRRYADRCEDETKIKVYSNQEEVELYVDGVSVGKEQGRYVFRFQIPIQGEHKIEAISGVCRDEMQIRHVEEPNPEYCCPGGNVVNWFNRDDLQAKEGYYSIQDRVADLRQIPEGQMILEELIEITVAAYGEVARNAKVPEDIQKQQDQMPFIEQMKMMGRLISEEQAAQWNRRLSQIRKES